MKIQRLRNYLPWIFGIFSLLIYTFTRFYALDQYPIYFFSDEAIHSQTAYELLKHGLRDYTGNLFPTYSPWGGQWNVGTTAYVHLLPVFLFGKSIFATRATSAVLSLIGTLAAALIAKYIFKIKSWWVTILLLTITPAWFLHSRTAFETVIMVSYYSLFLFFYLLYRYYSPNFIYGAIICGGCTFYAYTNGQAVMLISSLLLFFSDIKYHLQFIKKPLFLLTILFVIALVVFPYIRFRFQHPEALQSNLERVNTYLFTTMPVQQKLITFIKNYSYGLSPLYWFIGDSHYLSRHEMKGYSYILTLTLPLFLIGLFVALKNIRSSSYRAILIALLAAPFGASLAELAVTRMLAYVIPANLLIVIGLNQLLSHIKNKKREVYLEFIICAILSIGSLFILQDALTHGPLWYQDYALYGSQWGAKQLFVEAIPQYLREHPEQNIYVSSTWANGTDIYPKFFNSPSQVHMGEINSYMVYKQNLNDTMTFVTTDEEYKKIITSNKFKNIIVDKIIKYPDGTNGFYFIRLAYVEGIDAIFDRDKQERQRLLSQTIHLNGKEVQLNYSKLDMGDVSNLFDHNPKTLIRGFEANPFILEFIFPSPIQIEKIQVVLAHMTFEINILGYDISGKEVFHQAKSYQDTPAQEPSIEELIQTGSIKRLRIEIKNLNAQDIAHVHIRELYVTY